MALSALGSGEPVAGHNPHAHIPAWVEAELAHTHALSAAYKELVGRLTEGNERFIAGAYGPEGRDAERRTEVATAQQPFAILLTCSDSRLPPELVFHQGLGDLFVVRTAGNIVDDIVLGSIEYAVEHLHAKLIVVLGHERCGAVQAAVAGGEIPGHIASITKKIGGSVEFAKGKEGDIVENSVFANILAIMKELQTSEPILATMLHHDEIEIVGARYDLDDGHVSWLY